MAAEPIDFHAAGLLDGLEGEQRGERLALLEQLVAAGVPLEDLRRATENGTLMFLLADRIVGGGERYTAEEIAQRTGIGPDFLVLVRRAMGLPIPEPDEPVYGEVDLESVHMIHAGRAAGVRDEDMLELLRVLGRNLAQVAETLRAMPLKAVLRPGMSEPELASSYAEAVARMYPLVNPMLANVLALHLRQATQSEVINALERSGGRLPGAREVTVCFADLVGFTRLGEEVPPEELGHMAVRLEEIAAAVAEPPVRLVKTIGDAAMLAAPAAEPVLGAALRLIAAADAEGEEFPQLRAGAARGEALPRAGDWFGRPVNLASRITGIARPGSLLVEEGAREGAGEAFRWSFAGERRLRGIRSPVPLFRVRPQAPSQTRAGRAPSPG